MVIALTVGLGFLLLAFLATLIAFIVDVASIFRPLDKGPSSFCVKNAEEILNNATRVK